MAYRVPWRIEPDGRMFLLVNDSNETAEQVVVSSSHDSVRIVLDDQPYDIDERSSVKVGAFIGMNTPLGDQRVTVT
jgi:hypothetical protein